MAFTQRTKRAILVICLISSQSQVRHSSSAILNDGANSSSLHTGGEEGNSPCAVLESSEMKHCTSMAVKGATNFVSYILSTWLVTDTWK